MKIALISQSYYPRFGGVTEHTHNLAINLRKMGHDVVLITSGPGQSDDFVVRLGKNINLPINGAMVNVTIDLGLTSKLRKIFKSHRFDLIHIQCPLEPTLPLAALMAAMRITIPVVGTFHMTAKISLPYEIFGKVLQRYAKRLDARIAVSESARRFANRYFPGKYHVIPNGVDTSRFKPKSPGAGQESNQYTRFLYVGRFDIRKQIPLLIDAFKRTYDRRNGCTLVLVGRGITRPYSQIKAGKLRGKAIKFAGSVSAQDLPEYYQNSDIFCCISSGSESFGIVLLEAMSSGLPLICSDLDGYKEIVEDGVQGIIVPHGKVEEVTKAMLKLVDNPDLRKKMGEKGRARALEYDWRKIAERTVKLYETL